MESGSFKQDQKQSFFHKPRNKNERKSFFLSFVKAVCCSSMNSLLHLPYNWEYYSSEFCPLFDTPLNCLIPRRPSVIQYMKCTRDGLVFLALYALYLCNVKVFMLKELFLT